MKLGYEAIQSQYGENINRLTGIKNDEHLALSLCLDAQIKVTIY